MREIGRILQVQVQRASLKAGKSPHTYYDPAPLLVVERLLLTLRGAVGITTTGEQIIDVHNLDHPESRNRGDNDLSFGFTSHYERMRARFGEHIVNGVAGENILIEADHDLTEDELGGLIALQQASSDQLIHLGGVIAAPPCVQFSQFALSETLLPSPKDIKETLQFLDHGCRAFYARLAPPFEPISVQAGDRVWITQY